MGVLPKRLTIRFTECCQQRPSRVTFALVGGHEYAAAGDDRAAKRTAPQFRGPFDVLVLAIRDGPRERQILVDAVDHVPRRRAAEHGPVALHAKLSFGLCDE